MKFIENFPENITRSNQISLSTSYIARPVQSYKTLLCYIESFLNINNKYHNILSIVCAILVHIALFLIFYQVKNSNLSLNKKISDYSDKIYQVNFNFKKNTAQPLISSSVNNQNQLSKHQSSIINKPVTNQVNKKSPVATSNLNNIEANNSNVSDQNLKNIQENNNPSQNINSQPIYSANYLNNPSPHYPELALQNNIQGQVLLLAIVSQEGRVMSLEINQSSGYKMLDKSAMETVKKWQFIPAKQNGLAVIGKVIVPIEFKIS